MMDFIAAEMQAAGGWLEFLQINTIFFCLELLHFLTQSKV